MKREHSAIMEAAIMGVPIFSLVDSNTDPSLVTYVIPANDDSPKSIEFIITYLATRVEDGKKVAAAKKAEEKQAKPEAKKEAKPVVKAAPVKAQVKKESAATPTEKKTTPKPTTKKPVTKTTKPAAKKITGKK